MRWVLGMSLLIGLLVGAPAAQAQDSSVTLGGVPVALGPGTRQVLTVNHGRGYHARVALWRYDGSRWRRVMSASDGRIGYGGLVRGDRRHQGTGTTPLGTYDLLSAFGTHAPSAAWAMSYRRIRRGDFWVEDNGSRFYNRYRNQSQGGFRWRIPASRVNGSERLTDYPVQYEYALVTSYNYAAQVRYRGAGIFVHVNGSGATGGCVSAPRWFLRGLLGRLRPGLRPVVAIGR